jgi:hypothetical protein
VYDLSSSVTKAQQKSVQRTRCSSSKASVFQAQKISVVSLPPLSFFGPVEILVHFQHSSPLKFACQTRLIRQSIKETRMIKPIET